MAFALGLGTMVGWKRIVVTVGERIGKSHLTYAQGAAAEGWWRWAPSPGPTCSACPSPPPMSSRPAWPRTMAANRSGLQMSTIRNLCIAWVLTLPVSILLAGALYLLLASIF